MGFRRNVLNAAKRLKEAPEQRKPGGFRRFEEFGVQGLVKPSEGEPGARGFKRKHVEPKPLEIPRGGLHAFGLKEAAHKGLDEFEGIKDKPLTTADKVMERKRKMYEKTKEAAEPESDGRTEIPADGFVSQEPGKVVGEPWKLTREQFYEQKFWRDPKAGRHPASGSGRLPTNRVPFFEREGDHWRVVDPYRDPAEIRWFEKVEHAKAYLEGLFDRYQLMAPEVVGYAVAPAAQSLVEPIAEPSEVERPANALTDVRSLYDIMPERGWKCTSSTRDGDIFTSRKAVGWRVVAGAGFYAIEKPHPMDASQWHAARQVQLNECIAELQHNFLAWLDELERTGTLKGTLIQKGYDGKVVNEFIEGVEEGFF